MRTHLLGSLVLMSLVLALRVWAGFDEGVVAYNRGDYATAVRDWLPLAQRGDAAAQNGIGVMYVNGQGVPLDYTQAVQWYRRAAEQGYAAAQFNLGVMYDKGRGVPQNYPEALTWYRRAAAQGFVEAQSNLGFLYTHGRGVPQNYPEALIWYRRAAEQGLAEAQLNLGFMYEQGHGVPQDYAAAVQWYRRAAEQGYAGAQNNLGVKYEYGHGVPQDYQQAYVWYNLAAAQISFAEREKAVQNRDRIATRLTPLQLAQAQAQVLNWQPKPQTPSVPAQPERMWTLWLCKGELSASPTCNVAGPFPEKAACIADMEKRIALLTAPKGIRIPITRVSDTEIHFKIQTVTRGIALPVASYVDVCLPETHDPRGR